MCVRSERVKSRHGEVKSGHGEVKSGHGGEVWTSRGDYASKIPLIKLYVRTDLNVQ